MPRRHDHAWRSSPTCAPGAARGEDRRRGAIGRRKPYYSIYQKMIKPGNRRVRRDLRPGRHPRPRRLGRRGLLRRCSATVHARVEPGPRPSSRTTSPMPKFEPVPVAAHHGDRPRRQASGAADPHLEHAQARGVPHRRALEVRGGRGERGPRPADGRVEERPHQDGRRDRRDGLAAPAGRLAAREPRSRRSSWTPSVSTWSARRSTSSPAWRGRSRLPHNATPVDFAYAIHTDVGHHTIGARVNGRLVSLESTLDNGETVEIFTSKSQEASPNQDWLTFVKSARARNKIRQWFSKERREAAVEAGKNQIAEIMRKNDPAEATSPAPKEPLARPRSGSDPAPRSRAPRTSGCACPSAVRPCPATRSPASSPTATASRSTARTARMSPACPTPSVNVWSACAGRRPTPRYSW